MHRPHLLILLTDDHGAWAMPRHGSGLARLLHAPTLAWLADTGNTFTRAVTPSPVCSPARASFWSGLLPSAHGIHDYLKEEFSSEPPVQTHPGLTDPNLGQRMQAAGYHTLFSGKWHCGGLGSVQPGFDRWSSMTAGTNARFGPQPFCIDGQAVHRHGHQAPAIVDDALRFLRERPDDRPFFAFVGMTDPHTPLDHQSPARLRQLYADLPIEPPHDEPFDPVHGKPRFPTYPDPDRHRAHLADYLAAVSMVDQQIGRLIDHLDSTGDLDNTLIVYTSDHGHLNGHRGLISKGNATIPQNLLDGSIHIPMIWHGPGVAPGATCDLPVDHCDLHATLAAIAGCPDDQATSLRPGRDCRPLIEGRPIDDWRTWQVCEYGNARAWIDDHWKLIQRFPGPNGSFPDELYDLRADPRESRNVRDDHRDIADRLRRRLDDHFARHERPDRSGRTIADQPQAADNSSWLLPR